jgi:hypothetical protein
MGMRCRIAWHACHCHYERIAVIDYSEILIQIKALERAAHKAALHRNIDELEKCADLFIEHALDLRVYCIAFKKSMQA